MTSETKSVLYGPSLAATRDYSPGELFLLDQPVITIPYLIDATLSDQLQLVWKSVAAASLQVQELVASMHIPNTEELPKDLLKDVTDSADVYLSSLHASAPPGLTLQLASKPIAELPSTGSPARTPSRDTLICVALAWMMNTHAFCGDFTAALPRGRLLAHSCIPSLVYSSERDGAYFYAIRPILTGEIASFCYFEYWLLLAPTWRRQRELQEQRGFTCLCTRCRGLQHIACDLLIDEQRLITREACEQLEARLLGCTTATELAALHVELAARCGREHWLALRAAELLGAALLAADELTRAADLLSHFYQFLFVHELLIFFAWPAARAAKKLGTLQGAAIRTLVEREVLRVKMPALETDLTDCMNGHIP